jgi:hypothetical protein
MDGWYNHEAMPSGDANNMSETMLAGLPKAMPVMMHTYAVMEKEDERTRSDRRTTTNVGFGKGAWGPGALSSFLTFPPLAITVLSHPSISLPLQPSGQRARVWVYLGEAAAPRST